MSPKIVWLHEFELISISQSPRNANPSEFDFSARLASAMLQCVSVVTRARLKSTILECSTYMQDLGGYGSRRQG